VSTALKNDFSGRMDALPSDEAESNARPGQLVPRRGNRIRPVPWRIVRAPRVCRTLSKRWHVPRAFPKISTILFSKKTSSKKTSLFENGELPMRLGQAIFFGSAAALLTLAAPTLARNSSAHSHTAKVTGLLLPGLPAGGRRFVDAITLSGDGLQGAAIEIRIEARHRGNTVSGIAR
jgi:hypothetical protein